MKRTRTDWRKAEFLRIHGIDYAANSPRQAIEMAFVGKIVMSPSASLNDLAGGLMEVMDVGKSRVFKTLMLLVNSTTVEEFRNQAFIAGIERPANSKVQ